MPRNACHPRVSGRTARGRTNWAVLVPPKNVNCTCAHTQRCTDGVQRQLRARRRGPTAPAQATGSGLFYACAITAPRPTLASCPRARSAPPTSLPFPSPAARAEHCGTQTKCPQTGWSESSGNGRGAGPHARGGGSLPTSPPLPSLPFPFPTPPRGENASRRRAPQTAACPRPTAPNGRPRAAPRAPSLLPSGPRERRGCSPPAASLAPLAGKLLAVPPCPSHRLSTGLGAAARDRVPSASRGRREAASRALRPLPPGCRRRRRRRRHLAASARRGEEEERQDSGPRHRRPQVMGREGEPAARPERGLGQPLLAARDGLRPRRG